ncbi:MAG: type II toxin-antitoxin system VapC family toxin [Planctomycetota bacterium]|jgi:predicted nucleic acid-binding protein
MILVDTSVWVDHLRRGNASLAARLDAAEVLCHPFIIGELACGNLTRRKELFSLLAKLPGSVVADHDEVLTFVETTRLMGSGIGWVDAHLLASVVLSRARFWTLDRRLGDVAVSLGVQAAI